MDICWVVTCMAPTNFMHTTAQKVQGMTITLAFMGCGLKPVTIKLGLQLILNQIYSPSPVGLHTLIAKIFLALYTVGSSYNIFFTTYNGTSKLSVIK